MEPATFKKLSRGMVIALAVAAALAGADIKIPTGKTSAGNWEFAATHPLILLHIIAATAVLVMALIALIVSVRSRGRSRPWITLSAAGLAFVLLAFASGVDYVATLRPGADDSMGIGWFGAIVTYGTGWYLARKTAQRGKEPVSPRGIM